MIKTKTIKTDKATLLVVELPEGGKRIAGIACDITGHFILWDDGGSYHDDNRPHGQFRIDDNLRNKWQLLGRLPDITEDDASKVVDEYIYNTGEIDGYYNYENDTQTDCPIESINSLMCTNEIYFENPLGDEPKYSHYNYGNAYPSPSERKRFERDLQDWQEAQSKVWDKERTFLFIKVD